MNGDYVAIQLGLLDNETMTEVLCSGDAVMLVRTGNGGDSNWLDVSKAKILVASYSDKGPQQSL
jgi:hypothetical protein